MDSWYDIFEDWELIEASFAMQYPQKDLYNIDNDDMDYKEFTVLLSGLTSDTPLGKIVQIRSEEDKNVLKSFTKEQHKIRNDWRNKQNKKLFETLDKEETMKQIKEMFKTMFS